MLSGRGTIHVHPGNDVPLGIALASVCRCPASVSMWEGPGSGEAHSSVCRRVSSTLLIRRSYSRWGHVASPLTHFQHFQLSPLGPPTPRAVGAPSWSRRAIVRARSDYYFCSKSFRPDIECPCTARPPLLFG